MDSPIATLLPAGSLDFAIRSSSASDESAQDDDPSSFVFHLNMEVYEQISNRQV
jgi:hypothetical protein